MENLKLLRKERKLTLKELASRMGVAESTLSLYENGKRKPDFDTLNKFAEYFGVSVDYLLGRSVTRNIPPYENLYTLDAPIKLPVYGEISAGRPICTDQTPPDEWVYEDSAYGDGNHFALRVAGNSMEPEIKNGSLAIIRNQDYASKGQIVACCIDGDCATLKRYFPQPDGSVLLHADNPEAESYLITPEQFRMGYARILGVLREVKRKYY